MTDFRNVPIQRLQLELAYSAARSDLEWYLREVSSVCGDGRWYDTASPDPDMVEDVDRALWYLSAHNLLERHVDRPSFVRIRPLRPGDE